MFQCWEQQLFCGTQSFLESRALRKCHYILFNKEYIGTNTVADKLLSENSCMDCSGSAKFKYWHLSCRNFLNIKIEKQIKIKNYLGFKGL